MSDDFPAAHSADTFWFAVDKDGHVAFFFSGEAGAVPKKALQSQDASILKTLAPGKDVPLDPFGYPDPVSLGFYHYELGDEYDNWIAGLYRRSDPPKEAFTVKDLPEKLQSQVLTCTLTNISFEQATRIQPIEHVPCFAWESTYITSDGLVKALPGNPIDEEMRELFYESLAELPKDEFVAGTYCAILLQINDDSGVISVAEELSKEPVWVSPVIEGFVCIFDSGNRVELARLVSEGCNCAALWLFSAHDETLKYVAYQAGNIVDRYESAQDSNDEVSRHSSVLAQTFGATESEPVLRATLSSGESASKKFAGIIAALGMPAWAMNSYERLEEFAFLNEELYDSGIHID